MPWVATLLACAVGPAALRTEAAPPVRPRILGISHAAFYVSDPAAAIAFYTEFLGFEAVYTLPRAQGGELTWIKINDSQTVELFPGSEVGEDDDRLYHIALETDDAEAMRVYLRSRGVTVPDATPVGKIGNANFVIEDPNGNKVEIVQYLPESWTVRERGRALPETRISRRLRHVGVMVGQLEASLHFYGEILGLRETWRGSSSGRLLNWVNMQVPEGEDYIEFMLYADIPSVQRMRTLHHICLEVDDVEVAGAILAQRTLPAGCPPPTPLKTGINGRRQINYFDPDGTRVEIMEPNTWNGVPVPPSAAPPPAALPNPRTVRTSP